MAAENTGYILLTLDYVDNMLDKLRAIAGAGTITFTEDFVAKYAKLKTAQSRTFYSPSSQTCCASLAVRSRSRNFLKQEGFTNRGGAEHLYTSLTQDEAELTAKHLDLQELCDFWGFVLRSA